MTDMIQLEATPRNLTGSANARRLRDEGLIPAVLYGKKKDNLNLTVSADDLDRAIRQHVHVVELRLPNGDVEAALVKEIQVDNLTDGVLHVDFGRVDLSERVDVEVELKFFGDAKGVKAGGHLETALHTLSLSCTAANIPDELRVDVSELALDAALRVKDIPLPAGITANDDADAVVVACRPAGVVEEAAAAPTAAEPEVVAKGKKDKDEDEA